MCTFHIEQFTMHILLCTIRLASLLPVGFEHLNTALSTLGHLMDSRHGEEIWQHHWSWWQLEAGGSHLAGWWPCTRAQPRSACWVGPSRSPWTWRRQGRVWTTRRRCPGLPWWWPAGRGGACRTPPPGTSSSLPENDLLSIRQAAARIYLIDQLVEQEDTETDLVQSNTMIMLWGLSEERLTTMFATNTVRVARSFTITWLLGFILTTFFLEHQYSTS